MSASKYSESVTKYPILLSDADKNAPVFKGLLYDCRFTV